MPEILLVRHAQSYANIRDAAFGNEESPLTEKGVQQAVKLRDTLVSVHDIEPSSYERFVLASMFKRPQQTAQSAGFSNIHTNAIINESEVPVELLRGNMVIEKHAHERWVPQELQDRARRFLDLVHGGALEYELFFTHGFFIAAVLTELEQQGLLSERHVFDEKRGYIPYLATVTPVTL